MLIDEKKLREWLEEEISYYEGMSAKQGNEYCTGFEEGNLNALKVVLYGLEKFEVEDPLDGDKLKEWLEARLISTQLDYDLTYDPSDFLPLEGRLDEIEEILDKLSDIMASRK